MPVSWTDAIPADAYTTVGRGRSRFRWRMLARADFLIAVNGIGGVKVI